MSKSSIYTANTSAQALTIGSAIDPGSIVRRYGCNVNLSGDAINVKGAGYYLIDAQFIITATNAGTVTISMLKDNVLIQGAIASATVAAGDVVTIGINSIVREFGCCADNSSNLTFVLSGTAETVSNASIIVERL